MNKYLNISAILFFLSFFFINPGYSNMSEHEIAIGNKIQKIHNLRGPAIVTGRLPPTQR